MHSIAPESFYGSKLPKMEDIQKIRMSRLMAELPPSASNLTKETNPNRSRSRSDSRRRVQPVKLFSGVGHSIRKPRKTKRMLKKLEKRNKQKEGKKPVSLRQAIKNSFDFSRTPYALPKTHRVALSDENLQNRKFFKSTVQVQLEKLKEPTATVVIRDFEDTMDAEEPFANIKKDVSEIISHTDWFEEEEFVKPQMTRQQADELSNQPQISTMSYIIPMEMATEDTIYVPIFNDAPSENVNTSPKSDNTSEETNEQPKYFPLFTTSPGSKSVLSDVTNKPKKSSNTLIKAAAPNDQYQIDAGQKLIGPTECRKCGMVYDVGDPIDEKRHKVFHRTVTELKYKIAKQENIVMEHGADRIVLVTEADSKSKIQKVHAILKQTEDDIGSGYWLGRYWKAFIYLRNDSVLGCLVCEPNITANRVAQDNGIILLSEESFLVSCGINRIWVKHEFRGQKIGTSLVNCLRKNFTYGQYLKIEDLAFSVTTPDGNEFAKKITGRADYLTYSGTKF